MRQATYLAIPILAIIVGCGKTLPTPAPATPIPDDVTYTVIEKDTFLDIKRSLTIRLNRRVSEEVLTAIAMKLKNSDPNKYDRTLIGYHTPDMPVGTIYWARTDFDPGLKVEIVGFTVEQIESLKQRPADLSREVIGCWLVEWANSSRQVTIFRKDSKLFLEAVYGDGSAGIDELVETQSAHGRRFDDTPDRGHGEYYLINRKGELQQLDADGPFTTAKKFN